ncbi:37042_t:CDS:2, partial [Gigaspora margarita]
MKHDAVQNIEVTELPPCKICNKKILTVNFESFTILPCGHAYHRKYIEKNFLLIEENKCPIPDCDKIVDPVISERRFSESSQSSGTLAIANMLGNNFGLNLSMNVSPLLPLFNETTQKKRTSKKAKKVSGEKVSSTLKQLIEELLINNPVVGRSSEETDASHGLITSYFDFGKALYNRYKELKPTYGKDGARALVKSEVRKEIPEAKFSNDAFKKRMERARKMFKIFNTIGKEKIVRVKSIPPGFILNLTVDDTDYVIAEVLKGSGSA